jgi:hypothetical protein
MGEPSRGRNRNERDYAALVSAVEDGRVIAEREPDR